MAPGSGVPNSRWWTIACAARSSLGCVGGGYLRSTAAIAEIFGGRCCVVAAGFLGSTICCDVKLQPGYTANAAPTERVAIPRIGVTKDVRTSRVCSSLCFGLLLIGSACAPESSTDAGEPHALPAEKADGGCVVHTAANVRADPRLTAPKVSRGGAPLPAGTPLVVLSETSGGDAVGGSSSWFQVQYDNGPRDRGIGWIHSSLLRCGGDAMLPEPGGATWRLPFPCNLSSAVVVTQGNNQGNHWGDAHFAYDFGLPLGTPMLAMEAGVVDKIEAGVQSDHPCFDGGGSECTNFANYVKLEHADGSASLYLHLQDVDVVVGQVVAAGQQVGTVGQTGHATGPHAHIMRMEDCARGYCASLPLAFDEVDGTGVPGTGSIVKASCL